MVLTDRSYSISKFIESLKYLNIVMADREQEARQIIAQLINQYASSSEESLIRLDERNVFLTFERTQGPEEGVSLAR